MFLFNRFHSPVSVLKRAGAKEIPIDSSYIAWWNRGSACIGIHAPYDQRLRYFVGNLVPKTWGAEPHGDYLAYTNLPDHEILFAPGFEMDSTIVVHEQIHDYLKLGGHPQKYFGDSIAIHCGIRPGHD